MAAKGRSFIPPVQQYESLGMLAVKRGDMAERDHIAANSHDNSRTSTAGPEHPTRRVAGLRTRPGTAAVAKQQVRIGDENCTTRNTLATAAVDSSCVRLQRGHGCGRCWRELEKQIFFVHGVTSF
jgi:hypothetical protein